MFSRLWKLLILALCSFAGIGCAHQQCSTCSGAVANPKLSSCSTSADSTTTAPVPVVAVKAWPYGKMKTYVIIGATPCSSCKAVKETVAAGNPAECTKCKTVKDALARAVPTPACNKCMAPKDVAASSPGLPGCSSCQAAKGAPAPVLPGQTATAQTLPYRPMPLLPPPGAPRPLDRSVADTHSLALPGQRAVEPHVTAKPEESSLPKGDMRDPVTGLVRLDHARDYSWVVGRLEYLHSRHQWRVRYAPYDVDDELGGVVSLTGVDHLSDKLQSGMTVRIQGNLVNPENHKASPEYYVYDLKPME